MISDGSLRTRLVGLTLAAAAVSAGCASEPIGPQRAPLVGGTLPSKPTSTSTTTPASLNPLSTCNSPGKAFELSLVAGLIGAPGPIAAAQYFVLHGGVPGYGTPQSKWRVADSGTVGRHEATLVAGSVSLHALQLPNKTWAVDSGQRCA